MRLRRHPHPDELHAGDRDRTEDSTLDDDQEAEEHRSDPAHAPRRLGPSVRMRALWEDQPAASREQLEHEAARALQEAAVPAMEQLLLHVPGSTYEEAANALARQAAIELEKPVRVRPEAVIDLRNPPEMGAYPEAEKLSNRVLRLTRRHWAKGKPRRPAEIVAEKTAIAEQEWARRPIGTARCAAVHGLHRCRGVFAYSTSDEDGDSAASCPTCGAAHRLDHATSRWVVTDKGAVAMQGSIGRGG